MISELFTDAFFFIILNSAYELAEKKTPKSKKIKTFFTILYYLHLKY